MMTNALSRWLIGTGTILVGAMAFTVGVLAQTAPQYAGDVHLGVTSCSGNTCHGLATDKKVNHVLQNEYLTWQRQDQHAKAYQVLTTKESERIARNLGLPDAKTAAICLDCHADNVPAAKRGPQFQISDGVGCESCHGGGQRWLGPHISGSYTEAQLVQVGMYPTADPVARARMCLSCHFGDDHKFVTHRIMGAGHPRMSFELNTFTQVQPAHYVVDDDYRKRKQVASGVKTWAIGQALALEQTMGQLLNPAHASTGAFPELVFYDCYACHHPMSDVRWSPRPDAPTGPGVPHFNDANALMLRAAAAVVAPDLGTQLEKAVQELHAAMSLGKGRPQAIAPRVRDIAHQLADRFARREFGRDEMRGVLRQLVRLGQRGDDIDYTAAEQTTMAIGSIVQTMSAAGQIDDKQLAAMRAALEGCYAATSKDNAYRSGAFVSALGAFSQTMALN
jgi:hypothetical protein